MNNYEKLKVWQDSVELVVQVYGLSNSFPKSEQYGLTNQINRSAVSIPSNIAEGAGRNSSKEFHQFLGIASGSISELNTQLIIAYKLSFINEEVLKDTQNKLSSVHKMLYKLQSSIQKSLKK
jgi:four helix bundle protein